jgi:uncharacterized protein YqeY
MPLSREFRPNDLDLVVRERENAVESFMKPKRLDLAVRERENAARRELQNPTT